TSFTATRTLPLPRLSGFSSSRYSYPRYASTPMETFGGKTTTLRTIMGWLRPSQGRIVFEGEAIEGMSPDCVFRKGIAFIPEDRRIFATLSVEENLILGLFSRWQSGVEQRRRLDRVFDLFPGLRERRRQLGKTLSGGEQQMLAIGRALVGSPKLLLV